MHLIFFPLKLKFFSIDKKTQSTNDKVLFSSLV